MRAPERLVHPMTLALRKPYDVRRIPRLGGAAGPALRIRRRRAAFAMTGGTRAHAAIQRNLAFALGGPSFAASRCQFFGSDLKVKTADDHIRYPDGFVTCTGGYNSDRPSRDPVVIFEVLSASTAANDRIVKAREYKAMSLGAPVCHARTGSHRRHCLMSCSGETWALEIIAEEIRPRASRDRRSRCRSPNSMKGSCSTRRIRMRNWRPPAPGGS